MKVSEIILEAPQTGTNAFSQMANQLGGGKSSTGGTTNTTPTGKTHTANPNNPNNASPKKTTPSKKKPTKFSAGPKGLVSNAGGKSTSVSPKDALKTAAPDKVAVAEKVSGGKWEKFKATKPFKMFGLKTLGPFLIWLDDMSSINELWDAGAFNDHGDKAGEVVQQLRTYYTQLLITRMGTMWVVWGSASFVTGMAVRALVALIPGLGWLANLAAVVAQGAVYLLLNSEVVQKYLTFTILENLAPDWMSNSAYGIARVFGGVGGLIGPYITKLKDKFAKEAPEVAKAVPGAAANVAKDAANAVKNTGSTVAKDGATAVKNIGSAPAAEPLGAMSDLAKDL